MEFISFCILSVDWRSSKDRTSPSPQNSKMAAARRRENKNTNEQTQNDKATLKQHVCRSSPLYLRLIPLRSRRRRLFYRIPVSE